jgi:hypothetical protein
MHRRLGLWCVSSPTVSDHMAISASLGIFFPSDKEQRFLERGRMAPKLTRRQIEASLLADRPALIEDIIAHLAEYQPQVVRAYPRGYLQGIVGESINEALAFGLDDVETLRVFVDLRWRISAGYFREPRIRAVLGDASLPPQNRFEMLGKDTFDSAWEAAELLDGPEHWRGPLWDTSS